MSQTWVIRDNAPVGIYWINLTDVNFTSNGQNFTRIDTLNVGRYDAVTKITTTRYTLRYYTSESSQISVTSSPIITENNIPTGNVWEFTNEAYRTITFETPPTGDLLLWLLNNAKIAGSYGSPYQDIHLEDKALWNQLQSEWEQDEYSAALNTLQDSKLNNKQLNADSINNVSSTLLMLQKQKDQSFKTNKITITEGTPPSPEIKIGNVCFNKIGTAEAYEEPSSYLVKIQQRLGTYGYTDLNPKTKAINTMISPSIAREKFNQQAISLDESMRLICNAIIGLRVLTVVVKDQQGNPIKGATVKGLAGNPVTNASGVASGLIKNYTLTIVPPYIDLQTKTVDVSSVTDISINVVLEKYAENTILRFTNSTSVQFSSKVKNIDVCCVGGGGGGSGGYGHYDQSQGTNKWAAHVWKGKGGGGGNIVNSTGVEVVSDTAYTLTIGSGGMGSAPLTYDASNYLEQRANTAGTGGTTSFRGVSATGGTGGSTTVGTSTNGGNGTANATGTEFDDGSTYYSGGGANGGTPVTSGGKIVSGPVGGTPYGGYGGYTVGSDFDATGVAGGDGLGPGGGGGGGNSNMVTYGSSSGYHALNAMTNGGNGASGLVAIKLHYI